MKKIQKFFIDKWKRIIASILVIFLIVCSMTFLGEKFTDPQTYINTIESIDDKKMTVLGVSATIVGTSTILAAVPDDATTPLADKLMDLSTYLLIVVCFLVLEKSLLTVFGAISCYILFPLACLFIIAYIAKKKQFLLLWATKFAILSFALLMIVPAAMKISDYIYEINQINIEQKVEDSVNPIVSESNVDTVTQKDNRSWWGKLKENVAGAVDNVKESVKSTVNDAIEKGEKTLNDFTDAVAVFVIAYCAIPIFIVFLFLWLLRILFGSNVNIKPSDFIRKKNITERD